MSTSIERAARVLQSRHFPGLGDDESSSLVPRSGSMPELLESASPGESAPTGNTARLGEDSTGGTRINRELVELSAVAVDEETVIPKSSDVIDEDEPHLSPDSVSPDTDSDLNDEALGHDHVDTYTGAVFRNSTDRVRAAHVRALRAKIDQVEASVDEAPVSMPSAPVRAARAVTAGMAGAAGLAGAAIPDDDQPPVLSMRNVVSDSALAGIRPPDTAAAPSQPISRLGTGTDKSPDQSESADADRDAEEPPAAAITSPQPGTGGKLSLSSIHAQAYLDPDGREDRMREAFEPMADELLEQMAADAAAATPMGRRILITSAEHGVGRSLCGVHLALSLAVDHGQTVCYLDLDFSGKPIVPTLGVRAGAGVADWLDGQIQTIDALVVPTELAGLKLIAPGTEAAVKRRAPRLDRQSMNAFLLAYNGRYPEDLVVMGAPALDDEANATMLAGLSGQVVVVVEANKTPRKQLAKALEALQRHSRVSLLLNKVKR